MDSSGIFSCRFCGAPTIVSDDYEERKRLLCEHLFRYTSAKCAAEGHHYDCDPVVNYGNGEPCGCSCHVITDDAWSATEASLRKLASA